MKTSNKLLVALLVLILVVPILIMMSFKKAIDNNLYTVTNFGGSSVGELKEVEPFKVILIENNLKNSKDVEANKFLKCAIIHGSQYAYKLTKFNNINKADSIDFHVKGDTLVIAYNKMPDNIKRSDYYVGCEVEVNVPGNIIVIADNATVNIDNSYKQQAMEFTLLNQAVLNVTAALPQKQTIPLGNSLFRDSLISQTIFTDIKINATTSTVNIDNLPTIRKLELDLKGTSALNIPAGIITDTLNSRLSTDVLLNAPYSTIKKLVR